MLAVVLLLLKLAVTSAWKLEVSSSEEPCSSSFTSWSFLIKLNFVCGLLRSRTRFWFVAEMIPLRPLS